MKKYNAPIEVRSFESAESILAKSNLGIVAISHGGDEVIEYDPDHRHWLMSGGSLRTLQENPGDLNSNQFIEATADCDPGIGLVFLGAFGVGKTTAISHFLYKRMLRFEKVALIKFGQLLKTDFKIDKLVSAQHLFIDEVQKPRTDAQIDFYSNRLHEIVDARYDLDRPTHLAGNLSWEELSEAYPSVASRLFQTAKIVESDAEGDYRGKS